MKTLLALASLFLILTPVSAQLATPKAPERVTWVEETTERDARGNITKFCSVNSLEGKDWRSEATNQQADIWICISRNGQVTTTPSAPNYANPAKAMDDLYQAINSGRAKYDAVDIISSVGFTRYRETGSNGFSRSIWLDREIGFPHRLLTTYSDGRTEEKILRIIKVDANTQRRLLDISSLYPFFGHYLDDWHNRQAR